MAEARKTYPILNKLIYERGIKKSHVAKTLGINIRTLYNKLDGIAPFTWDEVDAMRAVYFPDIDKDTLMANEQ